MIKDPVCDMTVNPQNAIRVQYKGKTYYFCSQMCKIIFEREPEEYVKSVEVKSEQGKPLLLQGGGKT